MRHKTQSHKFSLNKQTISRLSSTEMDSLHGGVFIQISAGCTISVIKTSPDPWEPDPTPWDPDPTPWDTLIVISVSV